MWALVITFAMWTHSSAELNTASVPGFESKELCDKARGDLMIKLTKQGADVVYSACYQQSLNKSTN